MTLKVSIATGTVRAVVVSFLATARLSYVVCHKVLHVTLLC